jgi:hypothetical protein
MTCRGGLTKSHPNSRPTAMISFLKEELSINLQRDEATFKSSETSFTLPKLRRYRRRDTDHFEDEAHSPWLTPPSPPHCPGLGQQPLWEGLAQQSEDKGGWLSTPELSCNAYHRQHEVWSPPTCVCGLLIRSVTRESPNSLSCLFESVDERVYPGSS